MEEYANEQPTDGSVKTADDVIAKITIVAMSHVDGVYYPSKDLMSGVADVVGKLGVETPVRGVKIAAGENEGIIDLPFSVKYGKNIFDIRNEVQEEVKEPVESMMGLSIIEVNIHVVEISALTSELLAKA